MQTIFPRLANRAFEVQLSNNLQDKRSWSVLDHQDNRPFFSATNGPTRMEDATAPASATFYQVRVFAP